MNKRSLETLGTWMMACINILLNIMFSDFVWCGSKRYFCVTSSEGKKEVVCVFPPEYFGDSVADEINNFFSELTDIDDKIYCYIDGMFPVVIFLRRGRFIAYKKQELPSERLDQYRILAESSEDGIVPAIRRLSGPQDWKVWGQCVVPVPLEKL